MSNRPRIKHRSKLVTKSCEGCGDPLALDPSRDATAVHDCSTGNWLVMPRSVADALNAMTDDEAVAWAGITTEETRRLRGRRA